MRPDTAHAVLTIDLGAIVANWRLLQAKHHSGAVVKADGYGLGARPVAVALAEAGCRDFFVATPNGKVSTGGASPTTTTTALPSAGASAITV